MVCHKETKQDELIPFSGILNYMSTHQMPPIKNKKMTAWHALCIWKWLFKQQKIHPWNSVIIMRAERSIRLECIHAVHGPGGPTPSQALAGLLYVINKQVTSMTACKKRFASIPETTECFRQVGCDKQQWEKLQMRRFRKCYLASHAWAFL